MFLHANEKAPLPSEADCITVAETLYALAPQSTSLAVLSQKSKRAVDAARSLRNFITECNWSHPAYERLSLVYKALDGVDQILDPLAPIHRPIEMDQPIGPHLKRPTGVKNQPWALAAMVASSLYERYAKAAGVKAGRYRESAPVAFIAVAIHRIGYPGVGLASIEALLRVTRTHDAKSDVNAPGAIQQIPPDDD